MCVYVFEIHVLKFFFERWFWELNMLIGSLAELHVGLHSCLCFLHLEKLVLKAGSTPPQYLLDTLLSVELLQLFLIAFPRWLPRYLSILASIKLYWGSIYSFLRDLILISSIFLDLSVPFYLPNTISLSLQTSSSMIFQAFSRFSSLGKLLISHSSCISCFET